MTTLTLSAPSATYEIIIGGGALALAGEKAASIVSGHRAVVVTDENVAPLWLCSLRKPLTDAGFDVTTEILPAGEGTKSADTLCRLWSAFSRAGLSRSDCVFALGGGVVGDVAGFAAGTYMRGVPVVQIPSSLLAQVDSSIGGKTGIDLPEGKNLVGMFNQPAAVICDTALLSTMPPAVFADGMAEVLKYGLIGDKALFCRLSSSKHDSLDESDVAACVDMKRRFVEADERDNGEREALNFGHTAGHAIEALGGYERYTHGQAVAAGMVVAARLGELMGVTPAGASDEIYRAVRLYGLPGNSPYRAASLLGYIKKDKKARSGKISLVLLAEIGSYVRKSVELSELAPLLEKAVIYEEDM